MSRQTNGDSDVRRSATAEGLVERVDALCARVLNIEEFLHRLLQQLAQDLVSLQERLEKVERSPSDKSI